jgi:hypothetical protein
MQDTEIIGKYGFRIVNSWAAHFTSNRFKNSR